MNRLLNIINARLSLRHPQHRSLEIMADVLEQISLGKEADPAQALQVIQGVYPTVGDFERDFPSLCFSLATGVGKTRLMGAFIAYLYLSERSKHFFVLAPNRTIYEKLILDFSPESTKYVFKGISEFANTPPIIITGDNYEQGLGVRMDYAGAGTTIQGRFFDSGDSAYINIFNIDKFNKEMTRMKRFQEYIGESYHQYLAELPDLVLLMDEAHRYRASAGAKAISELKPILGLELTATPKTVGAKPVDFKNVIYSYPLAQAMEDGFVKDPAVATRTDFKPQNYTPEALEELKLKDGVHHHEHVKVELETYARNHDLPIVHPFMLVVAQDTTHARQLRETIESDNFFEGRYKGRVIEVHSNQKGDESDEAMQRLVAVEHDPSTEIVIHVNKLKEGWDVTNLYTIVPLRASASEILTEQTIGRGLRLPYGKRTGVDAVDRLTIIAHDKFQAIIDAANTPGSIIRKTVTIGDGGDISTDRPVAVQVPSVVESILTGVDSGLAQDAPAASDTPTVLKTTAEQSIAKVALGVIKEFERKLPSSQHLKQPEVKAQIVKRVQEITAPVQQPLEGVVAPPDIATIVDVVTENVAERTIDIPRIVLTPTEEVRFGFNDFSLANLDKIHVQPVSQEILIQHLRTSEKQYLMWDKILVKEERPEDYLIRALIDHDEIDYDENADLLYKLAGQLVGRLKQYLTSEDDVTNVLQYHQKPLSEFIFAQMKDHVWETPTDYQVNVTRGFSILRPNNFNLHSGESARPFRAPLDNKNAIKRMVFHGFQRCCYPLQKFDSDTERRFAIMLEDDKTVLKWMKPASGHFQIEYKNGVPYEPDFVVETTDRILICEPKMASELESEDVQLKARAARKWCEHATEHARQHNGKPWLYLLIPHHEIDHARTLDGLMASFA
jgi:type III restriction enzyme